MSLIIFKRLIALSLFLITTISCFSQVDSSIAIDSEGLNKFSTLSENVSIVDTAFFMPELNRTRRIWIYLPKGYASSNDKYPVIYAQDGQNLFDVSTSFAGEWRIDELTDSLINTGSKKAIIVGIDNGGENRIDEYTPFLNKEFGGGDGFKYMQFIVETLKPYIDKNYKTLSDRNNSYIMGSSLGGLISFYGIMKYKNVFSKAVVMSPSFWFSEKIFFIPHFSNKYLLEVMFIAGDNESENMVPNIYKMIDRFKKMKYPDNLHKVKIVKGGKHNEKFWSSQFPSAYKWLMK